MLRKIGSYIFGFLFLILFIAQSGFVADMVRVAIYISRAAVFIAENYLVEFSIALVLFVGSAPLWFDRVKKFLKDVFI